MNEGTNGPLRTGHQTIFFESTENCHEEEEKEEKLKDMNAAAGWPSLWPNETCQR